MFTGSDSAGSQLLESFPSYSDGVCTSPLVNLQSAPCAGQTLAANRSVLYAQDVCDPALAPLAVRQLGPPYGAADPVFAKYATGTCAAPAQRPAFLFQPGGRGRHVVVPRAHAGHARPRPVEGRLLGARGRRRGDPLWAGDYFDAQLQSTCTLQTEDRQTYCYCVPKASTGTLFREGTCQEPVYWAAKPPNDCKARPVDPVVSVPKTLRAYRATATPYVGPLYETSSAGACYQKLTAAKMSDGYVELARIPMDQLVSVQTALK